jgi:hypothetical protein
MNPSTITWSLAGIAGFPVVLALALIWGCG